MDVLVEPLEQTSGKKDSTVGHQMSTITIANETGFGLGVHSRNQRPSLIDMLTGGTELSAIVGVRSAAGSTANTSGTGSATSATVAPSGNTLHPQLTSSSGTRTPSETASSQHLGKRGNC